VLSAQRWKLLRPMMVAVALLAQEPAAQV